MPLRAARIALGAEDPASPPRPDSGGGGRHYPRLHARHTQRTLIYVRWHRTQWRNCPRSPVLGSSSGSGSKEPASATAFYGAGHALRGQPAASDERSARTYALRQGESVETSQPSGWRPPPRYPSVENSQGPSGSKRYTGRSQPQLASSYGEISGMLVAFGARRTLRPTEEAG